METIKIQDRKTLSEQTYRLESVSFTKPDGKGGRHEQKNEVYFRPDAVAVLLVNREKEEFILARQLRLPVFMNPQGEADGYVIEACAGLIEDGESPEESVIREAREETGFEISNPVKIGGVYTSAGALTEYLHLFIAEVSDSDQSEEGGGAEGEGEDIQLVHLTFKDAQEMIANATINDAKTLLLLQHFFAFLSL